MTIKFALAALAGVTLASMGPSGLCTHAFADDAITHHDTHHDAKSGKPAKVGGAHSAPKNLGGAAAGIAGGLFGAAIGASVVDALTRAGNPDAGPTPAPSPAAGCHYESQPLFDASGQQVASRRVRICN